MDEVARHLDRTHFAWVGGTTPGSVFYDRITPNGNDYGKDLLRLHYQQHPH